MIGRISVFQILLKFDFMTSVMASPPAWTKSAGYRSTSTDSPSSVPWWLLPFNFFAKDWTIVLIWTFWTLVLFTRPIYREFIDKYFSDFFSKRILWVLIRKATSNECQLHMFSRKISKLFEEIKFFFLRLSFRAIEVTRYVKNTRFIISAYIFILLLPRWSCNLNKPFILTKKAINQILVLA